ncbi:MAG: histidinol-phosphate transaminase, partial [Ignavibacteria bacterium]|nr:histidinol-phosphate transaminase [Ignavibacteria bacterium]
NKMKYISFVEQIVSERERVEVVLRAIKRVKKVLTSDANFISFVVNEPKTVFSYLESKGIIIRDRSNQFNFDGCLRVSIGTVEENNKFLKELKNALS